jgi:hypothetical protein
MDTLTKSSIKGSIITITIDAEELAAALGITSSNGNGHAPAARKGQPRKVAKAAPVTARIAAPVAKAPARTTAKTAPTKATAPAGGKRPYNKLTDETVAKITKAMGATVKPTSKELAEQLGVERHTVVGWIRTMRSRGVKI